MTRVTPDEDLNERLAPLELLDPDGGTVVLGTVWSQRPGLLVHLRHFG